MTNWTTTTTTTTTDATKLMLISKEEYKILKDIRLKENEVTLEDLKDMLEEKQTIIKFIQKMKVNYQLDLWLWRHRWKEIVIYSKIEAMDDIIKELEQTEKYTIEYIKKIENDKAK